MTLKLFVRFVDHGSAGAWHDPNSENPMVQIIEARVGRALELMEPGATIVWRPYEDASKDQCTNEYQLR